jgi:hypothetical protein
VTKTHLAAAHLPVIAGLPGTGGGVPMRSEGFPWRFVIVGGFGAVILVFSVRAYLSTYLLKR